MSNKSLFGIFQVSSRKNTPQTSPFNSCWARTLGTKKQNDCTVVTKAALHRVYLPPETGPLAPPPQKQSRTNRLIPNWHSSKEKKTVNRACVHSQAQAALIKNISRVLPQAPSAVLLQKPWQPPHLAVAVRAACPSSSLLYRQDHHERGRWAPRMGPRESRGPMRAWYKPSSSQNQTF